MKSCFTKHPPTLVNVRGNAFLPVKIKNSAFALRSDFGIGKRAKRVAKSMTNKIKSKPAATRPYTAQHTKLLIRKSCHRPFVRAPREHQRGARNHTIAILRGHQGGGWAPKGSARPCLNMNVYKIITIICHKTVARARRAITRAGPFTMRQRWCGQPLAHLFSTACDP